MRQSHAAGYKLFVDYAGDGVPVVLDRRTGEWRAAQIFVAVLGASSFTYAQATWTQGLADWISGYVGALEAIGGVPALLVPDNTKVAVIKACLYDPQINRSYADMAAHYSTAILPARPRRPRDKAKVEQAVLMVERWLLGRLRHRTFHSLADVNAAIAELLTRLNEERPIRRLGVTRRKLLEEIDRPALKDLPDSPYVFAEWRICRVSIDYHVEVEAHYYSVPHRFVRAEVEVRFTARTVEIFHKGERIAAHQRMSGNHKHTTVPEHMASSHRRYAGWTIERIRKDAASIGPATAALCELILDERAHPEQGFRACLGILRLARSYGQQRLDAAATRAIDIGARTYGSVKSILANNLDRRPSPKRSADRATTTRRSRLAHASNPRSTPRARPSRHGQGLHRHRSRRRRRKPRPRRMACAPARTRSVIATRQAALEATAIRQAAPAGLHRGHRLPRSARPRLQPADNAGRRQLDRRPRQPADLRALRRRQELARLGARQQGLPRQSLCALSTRPAAVHRSRSGARRWPPPPSAARARSRRSPHPRRLGPRAARCRSPPRPPGDPRGPLRPPFHHRHQPAPRRSMARADR